MLGDHLYRSSHPRGTSCVAQLLEAVRGRSLMALRRTPESHIGHFGCAAGRWEVRRAARCKLYKMNLLCGLGCVLTTAGLTVLVLVLTHAITITIN